MRCLQSGCSRAQGWGRSKRGGSMLGGGPYSAPHAQARLLCQWCLPRMRSSGAPLLCRRPDSCSYSQARSAAVCASMAAGPPRPEITSRLRPGGDQSRVTQPAAGRRRGRALQAEPAAKRCPALRPQAGRHASRGGCRGGARVADRWVAACVPAPQAVSDGSAPEGPGTPRAGASCAPPHPRCRPMMDRKARVPSSKRSAPCGRKCFQSRLEVARNTEPPPQYSFLRRGEGRVCWLPRARREGGLLDAGPPVLPQAAGTQLIRRLLQAEKQEEQVRKAQRRCSGARCSGQRVAGRLDAAATTAFPTAALPLPGSTQVLLAGHQGPDARGVAK